MIVPISQTEGFHSLNIENDSQGQGYVEVLHFTDPSGRERVDVRVMRYVNTTAYWTIQTGDEAP